MFDNNIDINNYLKELKSVYKAFDQDFSKIKRAVELAKIAHEGQYRKLSGNPFIFHPLRVAIMVAQRCDSLPLILAAILHDTVEDSPDKISMQMIYKEFGDEVGYLVDSVTDNILFFYKDSKVIFKDKTDKLLTGAMNDARCAFLKLIDREHNNKTLKGLNTDKQIRKSFETQALYKPLWDILRVDKKDFELKNMCILFKSYMKENNITNVSELKSNLYNITFNDLDSDNFEFFYYNSDSIIREIEDKKLFENLIKSSSLDDKIEIISLKQDVSGNFSCFFKYKEGQIFDTGFKVKLSSFKY